MAGEKDFIDHHISLQKLSSKCKKPLINRRGEHGEGEEEEEDEDEEGERGGR